MRLQRRDFLLGSLLATLTGCLPSSDDDSESAAGNLGGTKGAGDPKADVGAGEDGYEAWLRYRPIAPEASARHARFLGSVAAGGSSSIADSIRRELTRGLSAMLGREIAIGAEGGGGLVVGTPATSPTIRSAIGTESLDAAGPDGFVIRALDDGSRDRAGTLLVASTTDRGALYGTFHLLRLLQTDEDISSLDVVERPAMPLRMMNHWDNASGSAERGYAGASVFDFEALPKLDERYRDYARLLASTGINACVVNNVNASTWFLESATLTKLAPLAEIFAAYGVDFFLSANFAAPSTLGGLPTASPSDRAVQSWWDAKAKEIYATIPSFGGFLVKASSEGQPGPVDYGASHADGANLLARALSKHGDGIVIWRAFVWHEANDRARVAYDELQPLDGKFDPNVVLQVKNGPLDFQVREAPHPLFGKMPKTNLMLELQLTQEYTGHVTHLCFLVPQWKATLDFDTKVAGSGSTIAKIASGAIHRYAHCGIAGVRNVGNARNWTGHPLAAANTYGFGRLAWNPALASETIAEEWTRLTFGNDDVVARPVVSLLCESWSVYEQYTSPLGCGFTCEGGSHYEPNPADKIYYHRADDWRTTPKAGVGFDRVASGYAGLYAPEVARAFGSVATCPEELLLFFHHVAYTHRLASGKTVIQHIYDTHWDGAARVREMRATWKALSKAIDPKRHADVLQRFDAQVAHAEVWRDSIVTYFFHMSGELDAKRELVGVQRISMPKEVVAGASANVAATITNATGVDISVRVGIAEGAGWSGGATATIPRRDSRKLAIALTAGASTPVFAIEAARPDGTSVDVIGPRVAQYISPQGHLRPWKYGA